MASSLTGLLLVLTLGVGTAEAWHGEEHEEEEHCVDCALCDRVPLSGDVDFPEIPEVATPIRIAFTAIPASTIDPAPLRRPDAARAPPA